MPPRLLITMGDVAGIGPEIIARAWPELVALGRPVVVGDPSWLARGLELVGRPGQVQRVERPGAARPEPNLIPCLQASDQDLSGIRVREVSAAAGRAAYDFLCQAIDLTLAGEADAIVTCPLHQEGLPDAGVAPPG